MKGLSYYNKLNTNFSSTDTLSVFEFSWQDSLSEASQAAKNERLTQWLLFKMELDTLVLKTK